ncbi:unnamed protein product, partial [Mesorhabditis belari]|uniref:Spliceosome-associated protein CWC27 homolog n=1 Tax=Mesorhabditis belari TaxID=2138241 RepID=A0AAF3JBV7_9BILA
MSSQYHNEPITTGKVVLQTSAGEIEIELWCKETPLACRNFIQLCMEGYYNGAPFHRLVKDFIIQGGDPTGTGQGGESIYEKPFKDEFHQRLTFNRRGLLGMANSGKDDNGSQFFITLGTDPQQVRELTRKHTLFGKIVGPTMFNMLKMTEVDVDSNERPKTLYKITGADVLTNPFKDIRPREKERRKKKKETKVTETKKLNLLSFGDEAEEDEDELTQINKKLSNKGKSAHDALDDEQLSKQVAVTRDEMADYDPDEDAQDLTSMSRIRQKLAEKRKHGDDKKPEEDEDLDSIIEQERKQKERERLDEMAGELKTLQKEYKKALRGPKERKIEEEEEPVTEVIAEYKEMRIKFKSKTKKLKSKRDEGRENQTMQLLERFRAKLDQAEQADILFDKTKEEEERKRREALKQNDADGQDENNKDAAKAFGYDLDAEDIVGTDWMRHTFVAQDEIDPNVTRAKDANLRDEAKSDWYDLSDPRHPINKRKRGEI